MAGKDKYASMVTPVCPALFPTLQIPSVFVPENGRPEEGDRGKFNCTLLLDPENPEHADWIGKLEERSEQLFADEQEKSSKKLKKGELFAALQPEEDKKGQPTGALKLKASMRAGGIVKTGERKGQRWERNVIVLNHAGKPFEWKDGSSLGNGSLIRLEVMPFAMTKEGRVRIFLTLMSAQVAIPEWYTAGGGSAMAGMALEPESFEGVGSADAGQDGDY